MVSALERLHDPAGERPSQQAGQRDGRHEHRDHLRASMAWIPVGEIQDDARKEPRFGDPEQKPQNIEHRRRGDEHEGGRHEPPCNHDAADPDPGADFVQNDVAQHLEEEIADEEHPGAEAVHGFAEAKIGEHLQLGEPDVDPIEVRHEIAQHQKRQQAPGHLPVGAFFGLRGGRGGSAVGHGALTLRE